MLRDVLPVERGELVRVDNTIASASFVSDALDILKELFIVLPEASS